MGHFDAAQLLSVRDAALVLSCSKNHVYRLIATGALGSIDIATPGAKRAKTRVRKEDIEQYLRMQTD